MLRTPIPVLRTLIPVMALVAVVFPSAAGAADSIPAARGEGIYREGRLASGEPLRAERGSGSIQGAAAACVNCHRRSGLGSYEGSVLIPPIIGPYLFRERAANTQDLTLPHVRGFTPNGYAYSAQTLAAAIRTGVAADGRVMNALMPRYQLDDASLGDVIEYLKNLSAGPFPGVKDQMLEIATIVTPDAEPNEREAMLKVIGEYFKVRNAAVVSRIQSGAPAASAAAEYRAVRNWHLQVWELSGPADTWADQLQRRQSADPAFAVVSGIGQTTWTPVQNFCERNRVPCLFPNLDSPPATGQGYYSIYFSRGVLLETDMILDRLSRAGMARGRVVQVYRSGDVGAGAAEALARSAQKLHLTVINRVLPPRRTAPAVRTASAESQARIELKTALAGLRPRDVLVLWLRPPDLASLAEEAPSAQIYLSGSMANLEDAPLPAAWRDAVHMTYPFDPPDRRRVRENFPHAWFRQHGIPLTADRLQSNTYLACSIVADALDAMLDSYVPDFLIERLETMTGNQLSTGYFPRLSLAAGQRFASKGGYIVKFDGHDHSRLIVEGDWLAP
jgi:ABC-type branched-subunit amino acid transport system substrate-binding protein